MYFKKQRILEASESKDMKMASPGSKRQKITVAFIKLYNLPLSCSLFPVSLFFPQHILQACRNLSVLTVAYLSEGTLIPQGLR